MQTKVVLFDLDGTLLPMDQELFIKAYFSMIAGKLEKYGYEPKQLIDSIWKGTGAMIKNDGSTSNEKAFWNVVISIYDENIKNDMVHFDEFYRDDFDKVSKSCGFTPYAKKIISLIKEKGLRVALATNPIFPAIATEKRIKWAGLLPSDFELYTTYENSRYCKPNLAYYEDILQQLDVQPEECLMVGNDVSEDMVASKLGMKVFLLTDCLINRENTDISLYPNGNFEDLTDFINSL